MRLVRDAYRHGKPVAALGNGVDVLTVPGPEGVRLSTRSRRLVADRVW
ncbi:hypothetical protein [Streptomyces monashensis]|nr:hypothetical protein [Streptomyces monashensis]